MLYGPLVSRSRLWIVLAAGAAFGCLATYGSAAPALPAASEGPGPHASQAADQQFGLNSGYALGIDFMARLRAGGVGFGRADLGWNFTTLFEDTALFDAYTSVGMSVQPVLNFADRTRLGAVPPHAFARWAVRRMRRFGPGGRYWSGRSNVVAPAWWEVVNEP